MEVGKEGNLLGGGKEGNLPRERQEAADLQAVMEAWPTLSEAVRREIVQWVTRGGK